MKSRAMPIPVFRESTESISEQTTVCRQTSPLAAVSDTAGQAEIPVTRIIRKLQPSEADRRVLDQIEISPETLADDFYDYSKAVVQKPWGYEYLTFQNQHVAVWILHLKEGCETSMHCHPGKKTSLTILSGRAECSTLENSLERLPGQGLSIGKGVFHQTRAINKEGVFLMEVESPVNKRDLVRFRDAYGREKMGYESVEHLSFNLQNYNYTSLIDPQAYYNVKKRFGNCTIQLARITDLEQWEALIQSSQWDAVNLLKGSVLGPDGRGILEVADMLAREEVGAGSEMKIDQEIEVIILSASDTSTRLSEHVITYLKNENVNDIFMVPGTSNAHLVDAAGRDTDIRTLALQTEDAAALAAESYAKLTGKPGVVLIGSGDAATAAMTGLANAWVDSTPLLMISGQSRPSNLGTPDTTQLRQLANRELDTIGMVRQFTKFATVVGNPSSINEALQAALQATREGRAGPSWIDIPIDILGSNIDLEQLSTAPSTASKIQAADRPLKPQIEQVLALLKNSERPVILAGFGIRAAGARSEFHELAQALSVPVLTSRRGVDLLPHEFPLYFGRPGTYGQRAANFIIQNADLLISIGCRLSLPLIGRNHAAFARGARKVIVDLDSKELSKDTVSADIAIQADAGDFMRELRACLPRDWSSARPQWLDRCRQWGSIFQPGRELELQDPNALPYHFIEALSATLVEDDIVVVDGGPSLDYVMQSFQVKRGQRIISSPGLEHQGFALPGAIGACLGSGGQSIVCLCEKKGFKRSIPELQTLVNNRLPIKIFIFNSRGDTRVQQVQAAYFGRRYVGSDEEAIIGSLDVQKLGEAYKIPTAVIDKNTDMDGMIRSVLQREGPVLCDVKLPKGQETIPRLVFTVRPDGKWQSRPLEDMYPFLDRTELRGNMIIDVLDQE